MKGEELSSTDFRTLAGFRRALREFTHFSEKAAEAAGLTPQQHQALLAIRAERGLTVGELAERLLLRPHSVSGLADRLERLELIQRSPSASDRRRTELDLTEAGKATLQSLSEEHRAELRRLRPTLWALLAEL